MAPKVYGLLPPHVSRGQAALANGTKRFRAPDNFRRCSVTMSATTNRIVEHCELYHGFKVLSSEINLQDYLFDISGTACYNFYDVF
jgi:hypothetical protein